MKRKTRFRDLISRFAQSRTIQRTQMLDIPTKGNIASDGQSISSTKILC